MVSQYRCGARRTLTAVLNAKSGAPDLIILHNQCIVAQSTDHHNPICPSARCYRLLSPISLKNTMFCEQVVDLTNGNPMLCSGGSFAQRVRTIGSLIARCIQSKQSPPGGLFRGQIESLPECGADSRPHGLRRFLMRGPQTFACTATHVDISAMRKSQTERVPFSAADSLSEAQSCQRPESIPP
jgi:hypothetical protein